MKRKKRKEKKGNETKGKERKGKEKLAHFGGVSVLIQRDTCFCCFTCTINRSTPQFAGYS